MSALKSQVNLYQEELIQYKEDLRSLMKEKNTLDAELKKHIKYSRELLQSHKIDPLLIPIPDTPLTYNKLLSKMKDGEFVSDIVIITVLTFFVYVILVTGYYYVFYCVL